MMRVIFAGTPDFAAAALKAIVEAGFEVPLVLTQPDRPKGRGMQLQPSPVKEVALGLGLTVSQPERLRGNEEALKVLMAAQADVMVVAAYGLILPQNVLDIPKHGCLNIHASLLPRWRGAAPIQRAIEAGDAETGVCIMQMDAGLDTGEVVSEHRYLIKNSETAQTLHDALMHIGASAIVADLQTLQQTGSLKSLPQSESGITYAQKLNKEEAQLDWSQSAKVLAQRVRAFNPVPVAWTLWQNKVVKIWQVSEVAQTGEVGTILALDNQGLVVACGEGALRIEVLQLAGGKKMTVAAFLVGAGRDVAVGEKWG